MARLLKEGGTPLNAKGITLTNDLNVTLLNHSANDEMVVAAARVSTIGTDSLDYVETPAEESRGLINFLMKNRHGTPFEHNMFTFMVEAPIAVFREWHRHRIGWSYNEESGRYKQLAPKFYAPFAERPLVQVGKPGHYEFVPGTPDQHLAVAEAITYACKTAYAEYQSMLNAGIAKEVARGVLPVYTYSSMYATCNARSLMSFLSLRVKSDDSTFKSFPMWEIDACARQVELQFARLMPITYEAFIKNGRVSP
jgi:thymidylate synthase (FAD)